MLSSLKRIFTIITVLAGTIFCGYAEEKTELEEIVVTATKSKRTAADLPTNINVITREQIVRSNARTVAEAVERALGITGVSQRGTRGGNRDVRIRSGGDTSKQVLVMIDGQPINDVSLGAADLEEMPVDNVERIEIIRGPSSALWGANALGGVINIITKKPSEKGLVTKFYPSGGSFGTYKYNLNVGVKEGRRQFFFTANKDKSNGWRENSDYQGSDFTVKLGQDCLRWGNFWFRYIYHQSEFGMPGKNTTSIRNYDGHIEKKAQSPDARMSKEKQYAQLEYENKIGAKTILKIKTYGSFTEKRYEWPTANTDDLSRGTSYAAEVQVDTVYGLVGGGNLQWDRFKRRDLTVFPAEMDINKGTINRSIFLQKISKLERITAILGLRYDHHSVSGGQTNPRLSVIYYPKDVLKLSANAGRAFRAPTFEDLYSPYSSWPASMWGPAGDTQGNTDLKPESAWGYDLGVEHQLKDILVTRLTLFRNNIKDLIAWEEVDPDPNYDKWRPSNVGKAYNQGVEAQVIHHLSRSFSQQLDYTYLKNKGKKTGQKDYKTQMYSPRKRVTYQINYEAFCGLGLDLSINCVDRVRWEDDFALIHKLSSYTLVNAGISQKIYGDDAKVFFSIDNIFDRKYQSREDYPLPGREIKVGLNLAF